MLLAVAPDKRRVADRWPSPFAVGVVAIHKQLPADVWTRRRLQIRDRESSWLPGEQQVGGLWVGSGLARNGLGTQQLFHTTPAVYSTWWPRMHTEPLSAASPLLLVRSQHVQVLHAVDFLADIICNGRAGSTSMATVGSGGWAGASRQMGCMS